MRDHIKTLLKEWPTLSYLGCWGCADFFFIRWIPNWFNGHHLFELSWANAVGGLLAVYAVQYVSMRLSLKILRAARSGELRRMLDDPKFPQKFQCIELLWPKPVREKVWQPAFQDEMGVYAGLRRHSDLRWLNFIFACKMVCLAVITTRIAIIDWRLSLLSSKRARLSNRSRRD